MRNTLHSLAFLGLTALSFCLPGIAQPVRADNNGWLGFRNDTTAPIIVRGVSIINRVARQGPPHVLQPGQECWDVMISQGNKLILVADAKQPTRVLLQQTVNYVAGTLFFSIQSDPNGVGQNPNGPRQGFAIAKVKMTSSKPATNPPPGGGIGIPTGKR
jgi:hypothetical protein